MITVSRRPRGRLVLAAAACLLAAGCTSTVSGSAVRDAAGAPLNVPALRESQLDDVMLSLGELASAVDAPELDTIIDSDEMSDNVDAVSDPACLGAIMGAEDAVYGPSGWTAVRDHVAGDVDDEHWVEQTAVLYPSEDAARAFLDESTAGWQDCAGFSVSVDDTDFSYVWEIGDLDVSGDMITQVTTEQDYDDWQCQHAMSQVSNLVVETWACAFGPTEGAVEIAERMLAKAAKA